MKIQNIKADQAANPKVRIHVGVVIILAEARPVRIRGAPYERSVR